jgi:hypothetical protein
LYVTCFPYSYPNGGIMQIDANSGAFQAYLHADFGDTYGPGFLEISSDRRTLFFGGAGGSEIDEFNVAAGQSSFVQKERFGGNGEGLNVSHDSHLIVYPNGAGNGVPGYSTYEIPTANIATVNGTFDVGPYPGAATFSNDDTLLYHGTFDQNAVKIFDTRAFTLVGSIPLDPNPNDMIGYAPVDVVVDRSGRWLFVATGYPEPGGLRVYDTGRSDPLPPPRLGNISTRGEVGTGDNVLIGGFVIAGNQPKKVMLRAIGPSLDRYGVPGALINPTLELHNGSGAVIATNDDWQTTQIGGVITSSQASEIQSSGFAPGNAAESAILATLPPGNYTAIVRGKSNTTGIALIECYDLDPTTDSTLGNISTRGIVQGGDNVLIAGTIVASNLATNVLIRALGPTLTRYGVPNALVDPTLDLYDANGALVTSNDNWPDTQQTAIQATNLAPPDNRESAILATLPPGNHTAIVRGKNGATGVALVEVYRLNN